MANGNGCNFKQKTQYWGRIVIWIFSFLSVPSSSLTSLTNTDTGAAAKPSLARKKRRKGAKSRTDASGGLTIPELQQVGEEEFFWNAGFLWS